MHSKHSRRAAAPVLAALAAFLGWNLLAGFALLLPPPPYGLLVVALLFAWFLRGFVLRPGLPGERRRWATLRLRPLGRDGWRATLAAIPVLLALTWALGEVWTRLVPVPPDTFRPFRSLTVTPLGRLSVAMLALVAAPLLEEMVFRGIVQRSLERRWGPAPAIALTAVVFALFHFLPWVLPLHFVLGLAFGYAVYATRSIWSGVVLHAANNALAVLGIGAEPPELPPTVWHTGVTADFWTALAVLGVSSALAWRVAGLLRRAGHGAREPAAAG